MGRKPGRVSLRLIENAGLRRRTMAKRKEGLKKKLHELTKLCDLDDACMIIYCDRDAAPVETWPPDETLVSQTLQRYLLHQQSSNKFDDDWDERLDGLSKEGLTDLLNSLDVKLNHLNRKSHSFTPPPSPSPSPSPTPTCASNAADPGLLESDFDLFEKDLHDDADKMNIHQLLAMLTSPHRQSPFPSLYEYDHLLPPPPHNSTNWATLNSIAHPTLENAAAAPPLVWTDTCTSSYSHCPGLLEPSFSLTSTPANTTSLWS